MTSLKTNTNKLYNKATMKIQVQLFLVILLLLAPCLLLAQQTTIDSLERVLETTALNDSVKTQILVTLAWHYTERDFEKSNRFANELLKISLVSKKPFGLCNAYIILGTIAESKNRPVEEVVGFYNKALKSIEGTNSPSAEASIFNNIGLSYRRVGEHDKAFAFNLKALKLAKSVKDTANIIYTLNNEANIYIEREENDKAIKSYFKSLKYAEQAKNIRMISTINNNLGNAYLDNNLADSAILFYKKSLNVATDANIDFQKILPLANLGKVYNRKENYEVATKYLDEAYALAEKLDYPYGKGLSLCYLMEAAFKQKKFQEAIIYGEKGLKLLGNDGELYLQQTYYKTLSDSYEAVNDFHAAYDNLKKFEIIEDSLYNIDKEKLIKELETKEKEQQLEVQRIELSKKTLQRNGFILLAVVLLFFGWYFWQQNQKLKKNKEIIETQSVELHQLYDSKNRFFANIAHELRTPLTLIAAPISTVLQDTKRSTNTHQHLQTVSRNVNYLRQLTNQILDLSKKEVENLEVQITTFKFSDMLKTLVGDFQAFANYQKIDFIQPNNLQNDIELSTDGEKLFIVLKNLLSNAFKYTNSGGRISFNYVDMDDQIQVTIQDTGRGIAKENLDNIFKRYFQNDGSNNTPIEGGTGLGLAVCKEYVQQLNGTIQVNSEVGKGSTFIVQFPKKIEGTVQEYANLSFLQQYAVQNFVLPKVTTTDEMPILMVVEDNLDISQYLQMILQTDYQVAFANNGVDALEQLETLKPDLIITDLMMPLMDGFELIENLKKQDKFRDIPIITLTARSEMADKLHALRIGVDDYLVKPFDNEELKVRIENLLENRFNRLAFIEEEENLSDSQHAQSDIEPEMKASSIVSEEDAEWLQELEKIVGEQIADVNFNANQLVLIMRISRSQLYRKTKSLTGLTPKEYIDRVRYHKARQLIEKNPTNSVKRIAYEVGFRDEKNFARNFKKRFGKYPSDYL